MVTFEECLMLDGPTDDTISAIVRHEHLGILEATQLGAALIKTPQGQCIIRRFMEENLLRAGSARGARALAQDLDHFRWAFPVCEESVAQPATRWEERALTLAT